MTTKREMLDSLACSYLRASEAIERAHDELDRIIYLYKWPEEIRQVLLRDANTLAVSSHHVNRAGVELGVVRQCDMSNERAVFIAHAMEGFKVSE